ncbi:BTB/POZ domain-containing protein [Populus alba x Populus x berolinensis]|nr:BTB/POZ domain-containing protein [Populus alba x Populus x berolinensis]
MCKFLQKTLSSFSDRLSKLFGDLTDGSRKLKVIFDNFPGGAYGFELMARFCYNNGTIEITPSNIVLLNHAAHYMEMGSNSSAKLNLVDQTEKFLEGINYWTWSELLQALKLCQDLLPTINSSFLLDKVLDCLVRLTLPTMASPFTCSSNNSSFQFSCDTSSTCSMRNNWSQTTWRFEDLLVLNVNSFDKVIRMMMSQKLDHATIFKFIVFRLKSRYFSVTESEKCKITELAINLLSLLDRSSLSCRGLFDILLAVSRLKNISNFYALKLERLVGSMLDQATLDHLLVPSPHRNHHVYDVNLVLRLFKAFFLEGSTMSQNQRRKVASLMDSYLIEVAPDILLKPSKFAALIMVLPDSAREFSDRLYQAIDMYLQVHVQLCEEVKMRLCSFVNHDKLSAEASKHLAQNSNFPPRSTLKSFITQKSKLNSLIHNHLSHFKVSSQSKFHSNAMEEQEGFDQILNYARKHGHSKEIDNLETRLQGMQKKVTELEKVCTMMHSEMSSVTKSRLHGPGKARSLPKLCS